MYMTLYQEYKLWMPVQWCSVIILCLQLSIPYRHWFKSLLLHFESSSPHDLGKQQRMIQSFEPYTNMGDPKETLAPGPALATEAIWRVNQQMILSITLCNSYKVKNTYCRARCNNLVSKVLALNALGSCMDTSSMAFPLLLICSFPPQ